jgi:hypothetical protein
MSYTITTTSGVTLATIADGTINSTTTSLTLIGKNYAGYGIFLNENYIKLLENFSSGTAPTGALTGQLWYDSTSQILKVYNSAGNLWKSLASISTGSQKPSNPIIGDLLWDTAYGQLNVYNGSNWTVVGPAYSSSTSTSGAIVESISDTASQQHVVVKFYVSNTVVAIVSKDATFTPATAIPGFTTVKPGITLISSSTIIGAQYTGDVSNALTLQGVAASAFLRKDQADSTSFLFGAAGGLTVNSDLKILSSSATDSFITGQTAGKNLTLQVTKTGDTSATSVLAINGTSARVTLSNDLTVTGVANVSSTTASTDTTTGAFKVSGGVGVAGNINVGSIAKVTGNLNALSSFNLTGTAFLNSATQALTAVGPSTFTGNVGTGNITLSSGISLLTTNKILPNANNTYDIGSSSVKYATVYATTLSGTASTAVYADLAERFEADDVYSPGTVVELGGLKEITRAVSELSEAVFGVISTKAAYLMNSNAGTDATHPAVAVNGRVPVRVIGTVKKGDRLVSAGAGLARAATRTEISAFNVIGRALENKTTAGEGLVEAIVKLNS